MLAMTVLAERYGLKGNLKARNTALVNAVILGSTYVFFDLISNHEAQYNKNKDADYRKRHAIETLAIYRTASLRGDESFEIIFARQFIEKHNIQITEDDRQKIKKKAEKIYADLQKARHNVGLGDFDNSAPPEVIKIFERLKYSFAVTYGDKNYP